MPALLIIGDTMRSPEMRHEVPLGIGDPFLYLETDGRRAVLTNVLEVDRIARQNSGDSKELSATARELNRQALGCLLYTSPSPRDA